MAAGALTGVTAALFESGWKGLSSKLATEESQLLDSWLTHMRNVNMLRIFGLGPLDADAK